MRKPSQEVVDSEFKPRHFSAGMCALKSPSHTALKKKDLKAFYRNKDYVI